ncbi:MAG: hypothetical protein KAV82_03410 [Phycisphaerae bacterium]|nr:hypothetical protein [Phycisphaerae bacterium]
MSRVLITWIGLQDLQFSRSRSETEISPVFRLVLKQVFDHIYFLNDITPERAQQAEGFAPTDYVTWLQAETGSG